MNAAVAQRGRDVVIRVKAVPGASRDEIAGLLGDRLKIRIAAAPEGGKANKAIIKLLAKTCGVKINQITIDSGHGHAEKAVRITGADANAIAAAMKVE